VARRRSADDPGVHQERGDRSAGLDQTQDQHDHDDPGRAAGGDQLQQHERAGDRDDRAGQQHPTGLRQRRGPGQQTAADQQRRDRQGAEEGALGAEEAEQVDHQGRPGGAERQ
jgi:hypothetical protein